MSLPGLPHELLLSICELLEKTRYINSLAQTNNQLYWHLNSYLYSVDVRATKGLALTWAAQHGLRRTAWLSLVEGADIESSRMGTIPHALRDLGFGHLPISLTPLQTALCYGSDSVARLLINHGAISSSSYPRQLSSCTNVHMAAAMGNIPTLKTLIDQGMDVNALDRRLRTPLHYAVTTQYRNWLEQAHVVMLLLSNNADPMAEDIEGTRPVSIGKKCTNPVFKLLCEKCTAIEAYEISLQDPQLFATWRRAKERCEEVASVEEKEEALWAEERREKQLAIARAKRDRNRNNKKRRTAAKRSMVRNKSPEREETSGKGETRDANRIYKLGAVGQRTAQSTINEESTLDNTRSETMDTAREAWSRMREEADQRRRSTMLLNTECDHPSGLWRCSTRKTCRFCGISMKGLFLCTDCESAICVRCNSEKSHI
jgi:hypothetical protein